MLEMLIEAMSYSFMVRAFIVGLLVSLCASLLGVSLVLKRYSMIGDGLSHVGFSAMAIGAVLNVAPLAVAVPVVIAAAFLLLRVSENGKIKGDAAIALISLKSGMNTDIYNYMFGSILSISRTDTVISVVLSVIVIAVFVFLYNRIFAITFDESFAKATGVKTGLYNTVLSVLTAVTVVLGMRMMGTLLISSLIIFPALTSMRVCKRFKSVVICSAVLSAVCFIMGLAFSYILETPTGATIVAVNIISFAAFSAVRLVKSVR